MPSIQMPASVEYPSLRDHVAEDPRTCVEDAIARLRRSVEVWRETEARPGASAELREQALRNYIVYEREFGWQWRNVEALLRGHSRAANGRQKKPTRKTT